MNDLERSRHLRFGDPDEDQYAYFEGQAGEKRMTEVREWIVDIRDPELNGGASWVERYPDLAEIVRDHVSTWRAQVVGAHSKAALRAERSRDGLAYFDAALDDILATPRAWADVPYPSGRVDLTYNALELYTSNVGYKVLFSQVKDIFRGTYNPSEDEKRLAAFVVELVNIDLYNKWLHDGREFCGMSERKLWIQDRHYQHYLDTMAKPPGDRDPSIPLALDASTVGDEEFQTPYKTPESAIPAKLRVHVYDLGPQSLAYYRQHHRALYEPGQLGPFQESIVSPICALPIEDVSLYPEEEEILLRGPFFQLLRMSDGDVGGGEEGPILDLLMISANRDHPSTPQTQAGSGEDDPARDLFRHLVRKRRAECTRDYFGLWARHPSCTDPDAAALQYDLAVKEAETQSHALSAFAARVNLPEPRF